MPSIRDSGIKQNAHMFVTSNWDTLSRKLCNYSEELMNNMGGEGNGEDAHKDSRIRHTESSAETNKS